MASKGWKDVAREYFIDRKVLVILDEVHNDMDFSGEIDLNLFF